MTILSLFVFGLLTGLLGRFVLLCVIAGGLIVTVVVAMDGAEWIPILAQCATGLASLQFGYLAAVLIEFGMDRKNIMRAAISR